MFMAARAVARKTKGRPAGHGAPLIEMLNSSKQNDSTNALRLQRLGCMGIVGPRARLVSQLAWTEVSGE